MSGKLFLDPWFYLTMLLLFGFGIEAYAAVKFVRPLYISYNLIKTKPTPRKSSRLRDKLYAYEHPEISEQEGCNECPDSLLTLPSALT